MKYHRGKNKGILSEFIKYIVIMNFEWYHIFWDTQYLWLGTIIII